MNSSEEAKITFFCEPAAFVTVTGEEIRKGIASLGSLGPKKHELFVNIS
jgi:hypothetical protein